MSIHDNLPSSSSSSNIPVTGQSPEAAKEASKDLHIYVKPGVKLQHGTSLTEVKIKEYAPWKQILAWGILLLSLGTAPAIVGLASLIFTQSGNWARSYFNILIGSSKERVTLENSALETTYRHELVTAPLTTRTTPSSLTMSGKKLELIQTIVREKVLLRMALLEIRDVANQLGVKDVQEFIQTTLAEAESLNTWDPQYEQKVKVIRKKVAKFISDRPYTNTYVLGESKANVLFGGWHEIMQRGYDPFAPGSRRVGAFNDLASDEIEEYSNITASAAENPDPTIRAKYNALMRFLETNPTFRSETSVDNIRKLAAEQRRELNRQFLLPTRSKIAMQRALEVIRKTDPGFTGRNLDTVESQLIVLAKKMRELNHLEYVSSRSIFDNREELNKLDNTIDELRSIIQKQMGEGFVEAWEREYRFGQIERSPEFKEMMEKQMDAEMDRWGSFLRAVAFNLEDRVHGLFTAVFRRERVPARLAERAEKMAKGPAKRELKLSPAKEAELKAKIRLRQQELAIAKQNLADITQSRSKESAPGTTSGAAIYPSSETSVNFKGLDLEQFSKQVIGPRGLYTRRLQNLLQAYREWRNSPVSHNRESPEHIAWKNRLKDEARRVLYEAQVCQKYLTRELGFEDPTDASPTSDNPMERELSRINEQIIGLDYVERGGFGRLRAFSTNVSLARSLVEYANHRASGQTGYSIWRDAYSDHYICAEEPPMVQVSEGDTRFGESELTSRYVEVTEAELDHLMHDAVASGEGLYDLELTKALTEAVDSRIKQREALSVELRNKLSPDLQSISKLSEEILFHTQEIEDSLLKKQALIGVCKYMKHIEKGKSYPKS